MPMEPRLLGPIAGFALAGPASSVIPQTSWTGQPTRSLKFLRFCCWQGLAAGPASGQARQIIFFEVGMGEQVIVYRRNPIDHGRAMVRNRLQESPLLEARHQDEGPA